MRKKKRTIIIISIIALIVIIVSIILIMTLTKKNQKGLEEMPINIEELESNFNTIFTNTIFPKNEENGDTVKLEYNIKVSENGKYDIDINIPNIKLDTDIITNINDDIFNSFIKPIAQIMGQDRQYTVYNSSYVAYVNNNILSVVIKCNSKEGSNPQRVIIRTYNYDMHNDKILTLQDIITMKNLNKEEVQKKIFEKINAENEKVNIIKNSGYNAYERDINNMKYHIENTTEFFLGDNNILYIVYPYGNAEFTSDVDLVIVK